SPATVAELWTVSRAHPRDAAIRGVLLEALPADDRRRGDVQHELGILAADPDGERARAALRALR
ncbi:MAG: hypothetical protein M3680_28890, partial [Myxococcota bacterium]|nr:hypothetical protein [Myxococcota bacterium]